MTINDRKLVTFIETHQLKACNEMLKTFQHHGHLNILLHVAYSIALEEIEAELKARENKKDCKGANPNSPIRSNTFENNKEKKQI